MKISISEAAPLMKAIPRGCFLARRGSPSGPLTMIGPDCTQSGRWNAMDLEGMGGPAQGDVFRGYTADDLREKFFPIDNQVTFQNEY